MQHVKEENIVLLLQFVYCALVMALFAYFMVTTQSLPPSVKEHTYVMIVFLFGKEVLASIRGILNGSSALLNRPKESEDK